jgi:hypothetical protein
MAHELRVVGAVDAGDVARLRIAARFETLEDVLRWGGGELLDVIVQDEYTHDVIAAAGTCYVVFDTT